MGPCQTRRSAAGPWADLCSAAGRQATELSGQQDNKARLIYSECRVCVCAVESMEFPPLLQRSMMVAESVQMVVGQSGKEDVDSWPGFWQCLC